METATAIFTNKELDEYDKYLLLDTKNTGDWFWVDETWCLSGPYESYAAARSDLINYIKSLEGVSSADIH